jgi:hypothetical protein
MSGQGEVGASGKGVMVGKGSMRVNMVYTCTHVCKCKNDTC